MKGDWHFIFKVPVKSMPIKQQTETNDDLNISSEIRDFNSNLVVSRYESTESLSSIEKKIINRIDIELSHKNPSSSFVIVGSKNNKYSMHYASGHITISKECQDKASCFKKLRSFILSLKEMPL